MRHHALGIAIAAALLLAAPAEAQRNAVLLTGTVLDSTTGRPLVGALVALTGGARATRTDVNGLYAIVVSRTGEVILETRRIGYVQRRTSIQIAEGAEKMEVNITLTRLQALDTVQVRAADRAIYGIVGTAEDLRPLEGAEVTVLGSGGKAKTDASGRFFIPIKTGRSFLVRAQTKGFTPQTMSVTVPERSGLEISLLLDSGVAYPKRLHMALAEFDQRVKYRSSFSALVPRAELIKHVRAPLLFSIRSSPSFLLRALRFSDSVYLFVDGLPRPGIALAAFDPADVEMIEAYTPGDYAAQELARKWPPRMPRSATGVPLGAAAGGGAAVSARGRTSAGAAAT